MNLNETKKDRIFRISLYYCKSIFSSDKIFLITAFQCAFPMLFSNINPSEVDFFQNIFTIGFVASQLLFLIYCFSIWTGHVIGSHRKWWGKTFNSEDARIFVLVPSVVREEMLLAKYLAAFIYFFSTSFVFFIIPKNILFLKDSFPLLFCLKFLLSNIVGAAANFFFASSVLFAFWESGFFSSHFAISLVSSLVSVTSIILLAWFFNLSIFFLNFLYFSLAVGIGLWSFLKHKKKFLKKDF